MKTYTLQELETLALSVFSEHPHEEYLWATSDGQFFLHNKQNAMQLHCASAKVSFYQIAKPTSATLSERDVEQIENAVEIEEDLKAQSPENLERYQACDYRERAHWIGECETEVEIEFYMQDETSKTVIAAAEKRIEELRNA